MDGLRWRCAGLRRGGVGVLRVYVVIHGGSENATGWNRGLPLKPCKLHIELYVRFTHFWSILVPSFFSLLFIPNLDKSLKMTPLEDSQHLTANGCRSLGLVVV